MNSAGKRMFNLKMKALFGFIQLILMLGICLFVPAWSFNFWQAWVYMTIFCGSAAFTTFYLWKKDPELLERRTAAGPGAEKEKTQKVIQAIASVFFLAFLIVPSLDHRFGWSKVPVYFVVLGDVLVALGYFFIFLVFKENTFAAAIIKVSADQRVITTGPYRLVRHPMYSGALLMLLGTPLALGSWWALPIFIPFLLIIIWRLLEEEKFLSDKLPGYKEYCIKVRYRLVPLIW